MKDVSTDGVWRKNRDRSFGPEARKTDRNDDQASLGVFVVVVVIAILIHVATIRPGGS